MQFFTLHQLLMIFVSIPIFFISCKNDAAIPKAETQQTVLVDLTKEPSTLDTPNPAKEPGKAIFRPDQYTVDPNSLETLSETATRVEIKAVGDAGLQKPPREPLDRTRTKLFERLSQIKHLRSEDINMINWEASIVTGCKKELPKKFVFTTSHDSLRPFMDWGFNMFALANNHSMDCSSPRWTASSFEEKEKLFAGHYFHGTSHTLDYLVESIPIIERNGVRIGVISMTYWDYENQNLVGNFTNRKKLFARLGELEVDVRVLSLHGGTEAVRKPHPLIRKISYEFIDTYGGDVVFAHHPHRTQGVEILQKPDDRYAAIFYSLGNFIHFGISNRGDGIIGRVEVTLDGLDPYSIQVTPLMDVVSKPRPANTLELKKFQKLMQSNQRLVPDKPLRDSLSVVPFHWERTRDPDFPATLQATLKQGYPQEANN